MLGPVARPSITSSPMLTTDWLVRFKCSASLHRSQPPGSRSQKLRFGRIQAASMTEVQAKSTDVAQNAGPKRLVDFEAKEDEADLPALHPSPSCRPPVRAATKAEYQVIKNSIVIHVEHDVGVHIRIWPGTPLDQSTPRQTRRCQRY